MQVEINRGKEMATPTHDRMPGRRYPGLRAWLARRWPLAAKAYGLGKRGFPFTPWPDDGSTIGRVRRVARTVLFADRRPWSRSALRAAMTFAWPVGAVIEVARCLPLTPAAHRPTSMTGWLRRAAHMLALAWGRNVPPREYVAYGLHDPAKRAWIGACLYQPESQPLLTHLNRLAGADNDDVQDKGRFARLCRRHDLPCIPTLAEFRGGVQTWPETPFRPDQPSLWVKDLTGSRGAGAARWHQQNGLYRDDDSGAARAAEDLAATWLGRDCLVQPCLDNHPALARLSAGGIVDFRVVTGIDRDGVVTVVATLAALPCGPAGESRFLFGAVDDDSRCIKTPRLAGFQPVERHPDTGADIARTEIPFWPEAVALVKRAHAQVPEFARFPFLGWDVAITVDGPVLIETNSGWGAIGHQIGDGVPLGWTAFPAIAAQYLGLSPQGDHPCD